MIRIGSFHGKRTRRTLPMALIELRKRLQNQSKFLPIMLFWSFVTFHEQQKQRCRQGLWRTGAWHRHPQRDTAMHGGQRWWRGQHTTPRDFNRAPEAVAEPVKVLADNVVLVVRDFSRTTKTTLSARTLAYWRMASTLTSTKGYSHAWGKKMVEGATYNSPVGSRFPIYLLM